MPWGPPCRPGYHAGWDPMPLHLRPFESGEIATRAKAVRTTACHRSRDCSKPPRTEPPMRIYRVAILYDSLPALFQCTRIHWLSSSTSHSASPAFSASVPPSAVTRARRSSAEKRAPAVPGQSQGRCGTITSQVWASPGPSHGAECGRTQSRQCAGAWRLLCAKDQRPRSIGIIYTP
jgi:hypothetical protein